MIDAIDLICPHALADFVPPDILCYLLQLRRAMKALPGLTPNGNHASGFRPW